MALGCYWALSLVNGYCNGNINENTYRDASFYQYRAPRLARIVLYDMLDEDVLQDPDSQGKDQQSRTNTWLFNGV